MSLVRFFIKRGKIQNKNLRSNTKRNENNNKNISRAYFKRKVCKYYEITKTKACGTFPAVA